MFLLTPSLAIISDQNLLVKALSLSDTMSLGRPCSLHISLRKAAATVGAFLFSKGMKCAILVNRCNGARSRLGRLQGVPQGSGV